jgi:hypothetical protein
MRVRRGKAPKRSSSESILEFGGVEGEITGTKLPVGGHTVILTEAGVLPPGSFAG